MSNILVIRFSALGDVAMLIPVLYSVAKYYPEDKFILLTKAHLIPIFDQRPENVDIYSAETNGRHKGIRGLFNLIKDLSQLKINKIADVHNVLRSGLIRLFFSLQGIKAKNINKGRGEKAALTRQKNKIFRPVKSTIERYKDVFTELGYDFPIDFTTIFHYGERDFNLIKPFTGEKDGYWIGIAPFTKHKGKEYPFSKMEEIIRELNKKTNVKIFLLGSKKEDVFLKCWTEKYDNAISVAGIFPLSTELLLMSYLDIMLTMDSGNMHLASLVNTPVISIWGATHPYAGFYGYKQDPNNAIQIDLSCRPCSVYGNKPCFRKDYACLNEITKEMVLNKIYSIIK